MRRLACLLAVFLVFLASCQKQQTTTAQPQTAQSWSFSMTLATEPSPPVESQDTVFKIVMTDSSGKPVSGASVTLDLKMTTMDMGKNEVTLADRGAGAYEGTGKFTMAGPWNVIATAKQGDKTGQQTFQVVAHRK